MYVWCGAAHCGSGDPWDGVRILESERRKEGGWQSERREGE